MLGDLPLSRALITLTAAVLAWSAIASAQQSQSTRPTQVHEHVAVTAPLLTPTREATGTAWLPSATPMYGVHRPWRGWDVRFDGVAFVQTVFEPGDRHRTGGASNSQVGSVNWAMFMARRNVERVHATGSLAALAGAVRCRASE